VQPAMAGQYDVVASNVLGFVTSGPAELAVQSPPEIVRAPASLTVAPGSNAVFAVEAVGSGALRYQWRKQSQDLPGATNADLVLASVSFEDAGDYSVVIHNEVGVASSGAVSLTVSLTPNLNLLEIHSFTRMTNGEVQFVATGPGGRRVLVQSATNLVDWSGLSILALTNGSSSFTDIQARTGQRRFYRLALIDDVPLKIGAVSRQAQNLQIRILGPPQINCAVEVSTDLRTWTEMQTGALAGGQFEWEDELASTPGRRFYRAREKP
jgi:hypothetical protein